MCKYRASGKVPEGFQSRSLTMRGSRALKRDLLKLYGDPANLTPLDTLLVQSIVRLWTETQIIQAILKGKGGFIYSDSEGGVHIRRVHQTLGVVDSRLRQALTQLDRRLKAHTVSKEAAEADTQVDAPGSNILDVLRQRKRGRKLS